MYEKDIKDACLEFATLQSQPLSFYDSRSFKVLSKPRFDGLQIDRITSQNIYELVETKYIEMKNHIINVTKGQIISIKMDTATHNDRSVLGIHLQMVKKFTYSLECAVEMISENWYNT
ncbi:hypothetical protein FF38_13449 [Lucilia cuprina]|uniref:Uncharacterized protein n=1 Tax=Lucilia cuprina TaxID=7375 RepID=A0A0L0BPG4_LUCCU|nr:hypothetical protein FF38_13449 [Lucilia cuprina]